MNENEIIEYVMKTPENTNPNILKFMLKELNKLPDITDADKDKYLHTNAETGNAEWEDTFPEMKGKTIHHDAVVELLDSVDAGVPANVTKGGQDMSGHYGYTWSLNHYTIPLEADYAIVTDDDRRYTISGNSVNIGISGPLQNWGYTNSGELQGKTMSFYKIISESYDEEVFPSNVINMYDENDPHGDNSYLPIYASIDDNQITVDETYDTSEIYNRLLHGRNVWIRNNSDTYEFVSNFKLDMTTHSVVGVQGATGTVYAFVSVNDEDIEDQGGDTIIK